MGASLKMLDYSVLIPEISVVIPTFNAELTLDRTLNSLFRQLELRNVQVVVVDNKSTDGTARLVENYAKDEPRVRLVFALERQGISHARNIGVRNAKSDFILICDSDDEVHSGWIDKHAKALFGGAEVTGGGLDYVTAEGDYMFSVLGPFDSGWGPVSPGGGNCGFSKKVFEAVGGFDENMQFGGEDNDFFWKAELLGYKVEFLPEARINYFQRKSPKDVQYQFSRFGRSTMELYGKFKNQGMKKPSFFKALIGYSITFVRLVLSGKSTAKQQFLLRQSIGRNQGILRSYFKTRT